MKEHIENCHTIIDFNEDNGDLQYPDDVKFHEWNWGYNKFPGSPVVYTDDSDEE